MVRSHPLYPLSYGRAQCAQVERISRKRPDYTGSVDPSTSGSELAGSEAQESVQSGSSARIVTRRDCIDLDTPFAALREQP